MSSVLSQARDISQMGQRKLLTVYGKSGSGKTEFGSTFPKPQLYIQIGDDGNNTISHKKGIKGAKAESTTDLADTLKDLIKLAKSNKLRYKSVFIDTFSMVTNVWIKDNAVAKNKRMTQQMWGDLKVETEELIRLAHELADYCWVILSCHEVSDSFEGMEEEILPDIHPSTTKGARTYLEGMSNYGIHLYINQKEVDSDEGTKTVYTFAAQIGANPYYWTKLQKPKTLKVPSKVRDLTYLKLAKILQIETNEQ